MRLDFIYQIPSVFSPALNPEGILFIILFMAVKLSIEFFIFLNEIIKFIPSIMSSNVPPLTSNSLIPSSLYSIFSEGSVFILFILS